MKIFSIVDYGLGNLLSLKRAFGVFGIQANYIDKPEQVKKTDVLILPGDGAFKAGMEGIKKRHLTRAIKDHFRKGKPILGICLGMQILFTKGYEFGACNGLDIIKGKVVRFPEFKDKSTKIPQIGWNLLIYKNGNNGRTILAKTSKNLNVYFVHSYICLPENRKVVLAETEYGGYQFPSIVGQENVFGCQFHPEKSGKDGIQIIQKFISLHNK
jgi:glutamine amidotransferase